ncbi:hypothetical protein V502_09300 [Pseudogymnoascus sp. VKM F-4520 (FW-2644)]|nr:hypothetical protein V502_09300 [Pseudogymnoascus sp. VKM F-4520 (FW-2644)]
MVTPIQLMPLSNQTQTPSNSSSQPSLVSSLHSQSQALLNSQPAPTQPQALAQPQTAAQSQDVAQSQTAAQSQATAQSQPPAPQQPPKIGRFQKRWNWTLLSSWRNGIEQPKVIVKAKRRTRYVHVAPICVSIALLVLNGTGLFIGTHLSGPVAWEDASKLQAFQIVAKMHEVTILSSLGVVVFDVVRQQLLFGRKGIPLGMVGLGFTFSQGDYLVSPEFWAMFTATIGIGRRIILAVMVVTLCAVANSAGPASAILMIPSIQTINRAGFDFFLNGTSDDLWPSTLESRHIGGAACINTEAAASDASCIGGGYPAIHNHFTAFEQRPESTSFNFDTEDRLAQRTILGNIRMAWSRGSETWTQSSHAATIMIAEPIRARWSYCLRYLTNIWAKRYDYSDNRGATVETEVPAVRVACVPTQNLSSQSSVAFPVLEEYENWYLPTAAEWKTDGQDNSDVGVTADFDIGNFSAQLQNSSEALNSAFTVRTQWIILPKQFGSTSAGLLVDISSRLEDTSTYNLGEKTESAKPPNMSVSIVDALGCRAQPTREIPSVTTTEMMCSATGMDMKFSETRRGLEVSAMYDGGRPKSVCAGIVCARMVSRVVLPEPGTRGEMLHFAVAVWRGGLVGDFAHGGLAVAGIGPAGPGAAHGDGSSGPARVDRACHARSAHSPAPKQREDDAEAPLHYGRWIRAADGAAEGAVDGVKLVVGGGGGNEVQNGVAYGNPATTP